MGTSGQHGACIHKYNRCFEVFVFPVVYLDVQRWSNAAVFCQIFVGRFGVSFSPFERLFLGRFGFGQSCGLSVIA